MIQLVLPRGRKDESVTLQVTDCKDVGLLLTINTILAILSATSTSGLAHEYLDLSLCLTPCCSSVPCTIVIVVATVAI